MKKRQSSFELLRIISMLMIISMHYMTKGMGLEKLSADAGLGNHLWWLWYAVCTVSVNVYVLISGYFLVDSEWHIGKVVKLFLQVLFYSWMVPVIMGALGVIDLGALDFTRMLTVLLPIEEEHYWFATSYVMLYLLAPVLGAAVKGLEKRKLEMTIVSLLVVFCGFKSINPYLIPWDKYGYDILWFICLFLIAGYIRLYGIGWYKSLGRSVWTYIAGAVATWGICAVCAIIVRATGKLEYYMDMTYAYNYVTVLIASVSLFYVFIYLAEKEAKEDTKASALINRVASCTFGVYLLHENVVVRDLWQGWLGIDSVNGSALQWLHMIVAVIIIFAAGVIVDSIRRVIFDAFESIFRKEQG